MRAAVLEEYNSAFRLAEIARPKGVSGQVLVRVKASGVNPLDTKLVEAGKLTPLVDERRFTLETAMEAHALVESGRTLGKVVVEVSE